MCEDFNRKERASVSRMLSDVFTLIFAIFWEGLWFKGDLTLIFSIILANYLDVWEESLEKKLTSLKRKKSRLQKLQEWHFSLKLIDPDTRIMAGRTIKGLASPTICFLLTLPKMGFQSPGQEPSPVVMVHICVSPAKFTCWKSNYQRGGN